MGIDHSTAFSFPGKPKPGSIWITKVDILMTRSCNKIFLIILLIREININTIRRYHYTPSSMLLLLLLLSHFSCVRLCDPIDGSPPGSPIPGILQARTLEWVAIASSSAWKWKVKVKLSRVQLFATPWAAAYQGPPSMGFSRQEYWSGMPLPSPENGAVVIYYL